MLELLSAASQNQSSDRFCTAVCGWLSATADGWRVTIALGGHPFPLRIGANGDIDDVGLRGDLLGVLDAPNISDDVITLNDGDHMVLYTDGVTEARYGNTFFGDDGLRGVLTDNSALGARALVDTLASEVVSFKAAYLVMTWL